MVINKQQRLQSGSWPAEMQDEGYSDDPEDSSDSDFERICDNPLEKAFFDKKHIEKLLASGTFVIILQTVRSKNSHCRAWNCPPRIITCMPNIRSDFRFNLKDLSGQHYQPNQYYHITCMEHIFLDLSPLVRNGQLKMEGGITSVNRFCWSVERFHSAIEDWFEYAGRTFDVKCYEDYNKAHEKWSRKSSVIMIDHQLKSHEGDTEDCEQCENIPDEPRKCDYFPREPQAYALSEVLASIAGVPHVDGLLRKSPKRKKSHRGKIKKAQYQYNQDVLRNVLKLPERLYTEFGHFPSEFYPRHLGDIVLES
ncbi:hypothetical protein EYB25_004799 [Talaromyces marneffei]|nr:hypothetical protein EYB25_004799 [Talaromyces marneffei]